MPAALLERPAAIVTAIRIFYLIIAIGVFRVILTVIRHADVRSPYSLILAKLFFFAACIFLVNQLGKGKNWARWTLAALLFIGIPLTVLPAFGGISHNPVNMGLVLLQLGLYIAALVLVFRRHSSDWFDAMRAPQ
jgi:hypothetical protein